MSDGLIEQRLVALKTRASGALTAELKRDEVLSHTIPAAGVVHMASGEPGVPEVTFPLTYHYQHAVEFMFYAQSATGRIAVLDALRQQLGAAIDSDRTLGGLCDWVEGQLVEVDELPVDGAPPIRFERVVVTLFYGISNPLT